MMTIERRSRAACGFRVGFARTPSAGFDLRLATATTAESRSVRANTAISPTSEAVVCNAAQKRRSSLSSRSATPEVAE